MESTLRFMSLEFLLSPIRFTKTEPERGELNLKTRDSCLWRFKYSSVSMSFKFSEFAF